MLKSWFFFHRVRRSVCVRACDDIFRCCAADNAPRSRASKPGRRRPRPYGGARSIRQYAGLRTARPRRNSSSTAGFKLSRRMQPTPQAGPTGGCSVCSGCAGLPEDGVGTKVNASRAAFSGSNPYINGQGPAANASCSPFPVILHPSIRASIPR